MRIYIIIYLNLHHFLEEIFFEVQTKFKCTSNNLINAFSLCDQVSFSLAYLNYFALLPCNNYHIGLALPVHSPLQLIPHIFDWIELWNLADVTSCNIVCAIVQYGKLYQSGNCSDNSKSVPIQRAFFRAINVHHCHSHNLQSL